MTKLSRLLTISAYLVALPGLASLYPLLDPLPMGLIPLLLFLALRTDRRREEHRFQGALLAALTVLLFASYLPRIATGELSEPVVNMTALVLAVRLVGEKGTRQLMQIIALALFALAASTLISIEMDFFIYLLMLMVLIPATLLLRCAESSSPGLSLSRRDLARLMRYGLWLPVGSALLMAFFFAILPRTNRPLWDFLNPSPEATVGFSETVELGNAESLNPQGRLAFRVESPSLPQGELYWRGNVLNAPSQGRWVRDRDFRPESSRIRGGRLVEQTFYPEDRRNRILFALDLPADLRQVRANEAGDATWVRSRRQPLQRLYYRARSYLGASLVPTGDVPEEFYLKLPDTGVSDALRELALELGRGETREADLENLRDHFRQGEYRYRMRNLPTGADALEQFLFAGKAGHCEFFATSFATLARLMGIPARLVGGYLGGEYNDLGGYYLITEDMAHVWVEVHLQGQGWVRIDPSRYAVNSGEELIARRSGNLSFFRRLWDGLDHAWGRAIVRFDLSTQLQLFRGASRELKSLSAHLNIREMLVPTLLLGALAGLGWGALRLKKGPKRERRLERAFRNRLAQSLPEARNPAIGLYDLAQRSGLPEAERFVRIYARAVYRDRPLSRDELRQLNQLLKRI